MAKIFGSHNAGKLEYYDTDAEVWVDLSVPTAYPIYAVHGTGFNDIWVGCAGFWGIPVETWHYDGATWTKHEINLGASGYGNIVSLWALSPTEVYAIATASNYSALWKWNGTNWSALYVHASSWWGFAHVQALSSTEVYIWGHASSAYPNLAWGIWKWDGSTLTQEPTEISGVSGSYIDAFTAVDSDNLYAVPRVVDTEQNGRVIWKGKFGGPWIHDYDFRGEAGANGFRYGGGMVSDPVSGYVYGVTNDGGAANIRKQRIKSGGVWSTEDGPPLNVNALGCRPVKIGGAGVIRIVQADYLFGDDCGLYYDDAWHTFNRDAYFETFVLYFDPIGFIDAEQTGDYELSLTFGKAMKTTGPEGVLLADPATYKLEAYGAGLPAGAFYPSAVNVVSSTLVRLTIPLVTRGEAYKMTVVQAIELEAGDSALGATADWTGAVSLPHVVSVTAVNARTVEVNFDRPLEDNADLLNPSAYVFTGGDLRADSVTRVTAQKVRINLRQSMKWRTTYYLSVKANP
jgi:hypothetical protein